MKADALTLSRKSECAYLIILKTSVERDGEAGFIFGRAVESIACLMRREQLMF